MNLWGITVEGVAQGGYNEIRELMNANIVSGDLPNLVAGFQGDAASYASDGVVVDLNPYYSDAMWGFSEEEMADLNQGILNANIFNYEPFNGARLAWPNQVSANVLAYNQTMLTELGFDGPPTTFEDFKAIACAAAESDLTGAEDQPVQGYPIKTDSSNFESMVAGRGGVIYHDGAYDFNSPEVIATFEFYKDLYDSGCAYIPDSQFGNTDDLALGVNPMALGSSAGAPFIAIGFDEAGIEADWSLTTTPWTEGNQALQVYVPSIIMLQGTPEQNLAAWLFLKFFAQAEQQVEWTTATQYFPIRYSASEQLADFEAANPNFGAVNSLISNPDLNIYTAPNISSYNAVRTLVGEALANVTVNGMSVEDAVATLQAGADQALADSM